MFISDLQYLIVTFLPVAILLFIHAYRRKSTAPLICALILFLAFSFDTLLLFLPKILSLRYSQNWNWEGKFLSFVWPWTLIYGFKWLSPEEMGIKMLHPMKGILLGLSFGLILGAWNVLDGIFITELPSGNSVESIFFQLLMPSLSEELLFRGLFFAILVKFLGRQEKLYAMILVSILFINGHLFTTGSTSHQIIWTGTLDLILNIVLATTVLAYLRLKTDSIWPGVICHGLINSLPFIAAYFWQA